MSGDVNQQIALPGGGVVVINEQIASMRAGNGDITASALHIVVPGIRPEGTGHDDQARRATPAEAVQWGADLLVIGRPVTHADDPAKAAAAIAESLG